MQRNKNESDSASCTYLAVFYEFFLESKTIVADMPSQEPNLSEHISTDRHDVSREMLTDILLGEPAHEEPQQDTEELSAYTSPALPENSNNHSSNEARDIAMMQLQ